MTKIPRKFVHQEGDDNDLIDLLKKKLEAKGLLKEEITNRLDELAIETLAAPNVKITTGAIPTALPNEIHFDHNDEKDFDESLEKLIEKHKYPENLLDFKFWKDLKKLLERIIREEQEETIYKDKTVEECFTHLESKDFEESIKGYGEVIETYLGETDYMVVGIEQFHEGPLGNLSETGVTSQTNIFGIVEKIIPRIGNVILSENISADFNDEYLETQSIDSLSKQLSDYPIYASIDGEIIDFNDKRRNLDEKKKELLKSSHHWLPQKKWIKKDYEIEKTINTCWQEAFESIDSNIKEEIYFAHSGGKFPEDKSEEIKEEFLNNPKQIKKSPPMVKKRLSRY